MRAAISFLLLTAITSVYGFGALGDAGREAVAALNSESGSSGSASSSDEEPRGGMFNMPKLTMDMFKNDPEKVNEMMGQYWRYLVDSDPTASPDGCPFHKQAIDNDW